MRKNKLTRNDNPDKTTQELLDNGWFFLEAKYEGLVRGMLHVIRSELDRNYWNKNQLTMDSPFDNTGAPDFITDYLTIRSYNWDENKFPNLDTDQLKVFWYKHSNRGVMAMVKTKENVGDVLANVLNNSIESVNQSFNKKGDV
jgi:hypothetical protein